MEFWNRFQLLKENVEKENDYLDVFLSHFEKNIEKVFSCKLNTPLYQIQEYFRYPRYKLENIIDETSLFYFEKQLRKLVQFKCSQSLSISSKDEDFLTIIKNNFRNNFHTVQNIKVLIIMQIRKLKGMNQKIRLYYLRVTLKHIVTGRIIFSQILKNKSNITDIVITLNGVR